MIKGDKRRYRKIKGDRGHHSTCNYHAAKLLSYISLYLLLSPSISFPLGFHQREDYIAVASKPLPIQLLFPSASDRWFPRREGQKSQ